ncbi:hypothetical protein [Nocardioides sp. SYSU DS0663]
MQESTMSTPLAVQWTPVVDERGRTHMEAHWYDPSEAPAAAVVASAAA